MSDPVPVESWVVVRTEPCKADEHGWHCQGPPMRGERYNAFRCDGCLPSLGRRAVLDTAQEDGDGVRILCGSIYQDPIGGWWDCDLRFRHAGDHESTEYRWADDEAWAPVVRQEAQKGEHA